MSRRLVVGLDPSPFARRAVDAACMRARVQELTLLGVAVVDVPGIEAINVWTEPAPLDFVTEARTAQLRDAEAVATRLLDEFRRTCEERRVRCETELFRGAPVDGIVDAARSADAIVIGSRTYFHFETDERPGDTLQRLLQAKVCPVLAVPAEVRLPLTSVLFPYDGSAAAGTAMRTFNHLTLDLPITGDAVLLCVDDDAQRGERLLRRPTAYLESYGYRVEQMVVPGDPRKVVLETARELMPGVVVLGAYGRSPVAERLFGSVTRALVEDGEIPLFLAG
jgi:nucleotide-binding universal stress UspA family protein